MMTVQPCQYNMCFTHELAGKNAVFHLTMLTIPWQQHVVGMHS